MNAEDPEYSLPTKVELKLAQTYTPLVVEEISATGSITRAIRLCEPGEAVQMCLHAGQTLTVREMTAREAYHHGLYRGENPLAFKERSLGCPICEAAGVGAELASD